MYSRPGPLLVCDRSRLAETEARPGRAEGLCAECSCEVVEQSEARIALLDSVPLTFGGLIGFQVENVMAAAAAAVTRLLADPVLARQLAVAGHASCAAYAWPVVREGWLEAYHAAAASSGLVATQAANSTS